LATEKYMMNDMMAKGEWMMDGAVTHIISVTKVSYTEISRLMVLTSKMSLIFAHESTL
jgi:hypothetical protein